MSNDIQTHIFENGFRFIYQKPNHGYTTNIQVFCDIGSINEPDKLHGASHLIEHMCFKGTQKIPNSKELLINFDKIGVYFNAYTEKRYTCYSIICIDNFTEKCLKHVSDILFHSTFKKNEFKKEEQVVITELYMDENNIEDKIIEMMQNILFQGSSYENPIDTLSYHGTNHLNYEKVKEMYELFYCPSRMTLSVVSNLSFMTIVNILKKTDFVKNKPTKEIPRIFSPKNNNQFFCIGTPEYKLFERKGLNTIQLAIGFKTLPEDKHALHILKTVFSGYLSSKFMLILREINGLIYGINCYTEYTNNMGCFILCVECDETKIMKNKGKIGVLPMIIQILNNIHKKGFENDEIKNSKGYLKGLIKMNAEKNSVLTKHNGLSCFLHPDEPKVPFHKTYEKYYDKITKTHLENVFSKYFIYEKMGVCLIGSSLPKLKTIQNECSVLRRML